MDTMPKIYCPRFFVLLIPALTIRGQVWHVFPRVSPSTAPKQHLKEHWTITDTYIMKMILITLSLTTLMASMPVEDLKMGLVAIFLPILIVGLIWIFVSDTKEKVSALQPLQMKQIYLIVVSECLWLAIAFASLEAVEVLLPELHSSVKYITLAIALTYIIISEISLDKQQ